MFRPYRICMAGGYSNFDIVSDFDIHISDLVVLKIHLFDQVTLYFDVSLLNPPFPFDTQPSPVLNCPHLKEELSKIQ